MTEEVPYREVHDLLDKRGWKLRKIVRTGDELRRTYIPAAPGRPVISFPARDKKVLRAHFEKIRNILDQFPPEEDE